MAEKIVGKKLTSNRLNKMAKVALECWDFEFEDESFKTFMEKISEEYFSEKEIESISESIKHNEDWDGLYYYCENRCH